MDRVVASVAEVVGKLPSGCSIATSRHAGNATGMLVSWIQQASMEPLLVTIAIRVGRPLIRLVEGSGRLVLNLIGDDRFAELARHFRHEFAIEDDCFAGLPARAGDYGTILENALGYIECEVNSRVNCGDHLLYIVWPRGGLLFAEGAPYVHIRKTAAKY